METRSQEKTHRPPRVESSDDFLSDARLADALADEPQDGEGCPPGDHLWALACGYLAEKQQREVLDHVVDCPGCFDELRLARLQAEELGLIETTGQEVARPETWAARGVRQLAEWAGITHDARGLRIAWRPMLMAAVVTACLLMMVPGVTNTSLDLDSEWDDSGQFRNATSLRLLPLVPDGQELPGNKVELRWQGIEGARYEVHVHAEDWKELVAVAIDLREPELELSPEVLSAYALGTKLFWRVDAFLPEGKRVSSLTHWIVLGGCSSDSGEGFGPQTP